MRDKQTTAAESVYPDSDGKPMAESDLHRDWMVRLIELVQAFFVGLQVYVSGNLLIYYVEGDPRRSVAPDLFVVKNCNPRRRRVYKLWEEGQGPHFVLETTSSSTRRQDRGPKLRLYAQLRVPEYFLYDPLSEWLRPPLQGFRLVGADYVPIEPAPDGSIASQQLGIVFRLEDGQLALFNAVSGERLKTHAELRAEAEAQRQALAKREKVATRRAKAAEARADEAITLVKDLQARLHEIEAELARLRGEQKS